MEAEQKSLKDPLKKEGNVGSKSLNIFKKILLNPEDKSASNQKQKEQPVAQNWIETYIHKLEFMFLKLGGEDEEMANRMKRMDKFEELALEVRQSIR